MSIEVRDNTDRHRFEIEIDGHIAKAVYRLTLGVITFVHTEVPEALSGRGIGSKLADGALKAARARGLRVVALCPFIASYIGKHPEFQDLLVERA
jgi:uncharacterized protein